MTDLQREWQAKKATCDIAWEARQVEAKAKLEKRQKLLCQLNGWNYDGLRLWTDAIAWTTGKPVLR